MVPSPAAASQNCPGGTERLLLSVEGESAVAELQVKTTPTSPRTQRTGGGHDAPPYPAPWLAVPSLIGPYEPVTRLFTRTQRSPRPCKQRAFTDVREPAGLWTGAWMMREGLEGAPSGHPDPRPRSSAGRPR
ncbi:hypothetical protein P7K49_002366 [Saguinus oedipus]|uniref:Uncharacterized protein n=1 Tax=Saguinus oedipus TaxID=9490 RepID=A0ABQ9WH49_SAGOE|nr:hypothetical protein P7K49_002366 [Saguinus oedipus]